MENIILNRTRLISALDKFVKENDIDRDDIILTDVILPIKNNKLEDYLIADDSPEKVSFCKGIDNLHNRTTISIARYIRRNLRVSSDDVCDYELDQLSQSLKLELISLDAIEKDIVFLSEDQIVDFYKKLGKNSSSSSCMTGEDSFKTRIYALNPEKVNMVVYKNKARALFWTTDNGTKVVDRIYPDDGSFSSSVLRRWATLKGFLNYGDMDSHKHFYITLNHDNVFPYLDSFHHGKISKTKIKVCNNPFYNQNVKLLSTKGDAECVERCIFCNKSNYKGNFLYYGKNPLNNKKVICRSCYADNVVICDRCGSPRISSEIRTIGKKKKICIPCLKYSAKKCTYCKTALFTSFTKVKVNGFDCCLCDNCSVNYYTCCNCRATIDESVSPKTIKRNKFYCTSCVE